MADAAALPAGGEEDAGGGGPAVNARWRAKAGKLPRTILACSARCASVILANWWPFSCSTFRQEVGSIYSLSDSAGLTICVENTHPELAIEITTTVDGHNLSSSRGRGVLQTVDQVPPSHGALVRVDTMVTSYAGFRYQQQLQVRPKCTQQPCAADWLCR